MSGSESEEVTPGGVAVTVQSLLSRDHYAGWYNDERFFAEVDFKERAERIMKTCKWPALLTLNYYTDRLAVSEFLSEFEYVKAGPHPGYKFKFRGKEHLISLDKIRGVFKWPKRHGKRYNEYTVQERTDKWRALTGLDTGIFLPSKRTATAIKEPVFFYLHRLLAGSIYGRASGRSKITEADFVTLVCFMEGKLPDYAHHFGIHLEKTRIMAGPIACGGMITHLLHGLKLVTESDPVNIVSPSLLSKHMIMSNMKAVKQKASTGQLAWVYHKHIPFRQHLPRANAAGEGGSQAHNAQDREAVDADEEPQAALSIDDQLRDLRRQVKRQGHNQSRFFRRMFPDWESESPPPSPADGR